MMAFKAMIMGLGLLFYIFLGGLSGDYYGLGSSFYICLVFRPGSSIEDSRPSSFEGDRQQKPNIAITMLSPT